LQLGLSVEALQTARTQKQEEETRVTELRAKAEGAQAVRALPKPQPTRLMPRAEGKYYRFIEDLPTPAMQSYYKHQFPYIFGKFGGDQSRLDWWTGKTTPLKGLRGAKDQRAEAQSALSRAQEQRGARGTGTVALYDAGQALKAASARVRRLAEKQRRLEAARDPFAVYLEKYPFLKDYMKKAPRERGEFPSQYAPPTRHLGF